MSADSIGFYVLTVPGSERCNRMKARFASESITPTFVPVLAETDERLQGIERPTAISCAFGHLDMMRAFLESDNQYAIFCEDDIHLRRGIQGFLP